MSFVEGWLARWRLRSTRSTHIIQRALGGMSWCVRINGYQVIPTKLLLVGFSSARRWASPRRLRWAACSLRWNPMLS